LENGSVGIPDVLDPLILLVDPMHIHVEIFLIELVRRCGRTHLNTYFLKLTFFGHEPAIQSGTFLRFRELKG
jgi:hypothetical protein